MNKNFNNPLLERHSKTLKIISVAYSTLYHLWYGTHTSHSTGQSFAPAHSHSFVMCRYSIWDGRYFKVSSEEDNYNKTTHWNLGTILNFNLLLLLLLYIYEFLSFLSRCDYEIKSLFWNLMSKAVNDLCLKKLKNERKKELINIFGKGWDSWKWETE